MTPQPFTPAGMAALQAELNALSQADLQTQANLIRSDFQSWVSDNFTLDSDQQTYLSSISAEFIVLASSITAYAVENKLPVTLSVSGTPTTFKLIHISNDIVADFSPDGFTTSGNVYYEVEYE